MHEYNKGNVRRLLVGYTADREKKDDHNKEKGIKRLEKSYKRGHNKFLDMKNEVEVTINYEKIAEDAAWESTDGR